MKRTWLWSWLASAGLAMLLVAIGQLADVYAVSLTGTLLLVGWLPGYAILRVRVGRPRAVTGGLEALCGSLGISYGLWVATLMGMTYLVGQITLSGILIAFACLSAWLAVWHWRNPKPVDRDEADSPAPRAFAFTLIGLGVLALFLRVWGNHYSDLQGDEAEVLFRAATLIVGNDNALLTHSKGPAEILIAAAFGTLTGRLDEFTMRLPFALASVSGVMGVGLLGRRLLGAWAGLVAAGLLAVNGVLVTYARTAQYQSLFFCFSVWAAWFLFAYYQRGRRAHLVLGTFLLASAFLTHFEAILLVPLLVFLAWRRLASPGAAWRQEWKGLVLALGLLGALVAAFYLPVIFNPQAIETRNYLARRVGSALLYNNFPLFYVSTLTYNAYYYLWLAGGLALTAGLITLRRVIGDRFIPVVALLGAVGAGVGWWLPDLQPAYLLAASLVVLVCFSLSPRLPEVLRGLIVWLAPAWIVYLFLVERPGNHNYVFFPALALWAGWGTQEAIGWLAGRPWNRLTRVLTAGVVTVLLVGLMICTAYQYLLVVRNDLEYILTYPDHRHPLFITDSRFPFKTRIGFGFPYRLGWQMVAHLYRTGQLEGDWAANDSGNSIDWYTMGRRRSTCYPRNVMLAEITYKDNSIGIPFDLAANSYRLRYRVWDNERLRMQIFSFDPLGQLDEPTDLVEPRHYPTFVTTQALPDLLPVSTDPDMQPLSPAHRFSLSEPAKTQLAAAIDPRLADVHDAVELVGWQLDETWSRPGGAALITLYWRAVQPVHLPFKVFLHLTDGDQVVAQADDYPACGTWQMPRWPLGQLVADRHLLRLPAGITAGSYSFQVGVYEEQTGVRLDCLDQAGNPAGNNLSLGRLEVRPE